jgi:AraC family transcriptional regulator
VKPETRTFYEAAVLRAVERVVRSLDEALDLESLAKGAALSTFHFHRVFCGLVGETPLELHRRLRLERAAERLCHTSAGVTEIAFGAGYETHEGFTRVFRHAFGVSPSGFRQRFYETAALCHGGPPTQLASRSSLHVLGDTVDLGSLTLHRPGDILMHVDIETRPALRLATVRHLGPYPEIAEAFHRLGEIAKQTGLYAHVEPPMLALYHDDPETTPASQLRSDAALVVKTDTPLPPGLTEATLPSGRYARVTHRGSYTGLGDTWARLMGEWLPASGHRVGHGPAYEVYVTDPRTTATKDLRTDLYLHLAE